jgi:hypothetical protein
MTAHMVFLFQPMCLLNIGRTREARAAGVPSRKKHLAWEFPLFRMDTVLFEVQPLNAMALSEGLAREESLPLPRCGHFLDCEPSCRSNIIRLVTMEGWI